MEKVDISATDSTSFQNMGSVASLIANLGKLKNILGDTLNGVTILYRGHANKNWALSPGIYRGDHYVRNEDNISNELIRHCPFDFERCNNSFDKLVKMQHYSLPTRLLDITFNPLVALYFAVCDCLDSEPQNEDGEVILFFIKDTDFISFSDTKVNMLSILSFLPYWDDISDVGERMKILKYSILNFKEAVPYISEVSDLDKVLCVLPKLDNPRIIRQEGAFFLYGIREGKKSNMSELDATTFRFNVKKANKEAILKQLNSYGINERHCFPEIDKVAHYIKANLH